MHRIDLSSVWSRHGCPVAPRCPDAMTTTNEGGNISNSAWNLFFANDGTFSRLPCRSKCTKSAAARHRRDGLLTQNGLKARDGWRATRHKTFLCNRFVRLRVPGVVTLCGESG